MENPPLASLSLTHVRYDPNDPFSYISAYLALVPQALCIVYVTLIWATREIEVLSLFTGQMACEALNFGLKRWIREERPRQMSTKGYGMPSSHAQFVSFFALSLSLFLLYRFQPSPSPNTKNDNTNHKSSYQQQQTYSRPTRYILSFLCLTLACFVSYSRIYLNYHTPRQVLVGMLAGFAFSLIWFTATGFLRHAGFIEAVCHTPLGRLLKLRDLVTHEEVWEAGWGRWVEMAELKRRSIADPKKRGALPNGVKSRGMKRS